MVCNRCKTENAEDAKFCTGCGNDLTVNVDAPNQEELQNLAKALNEQAVVTKKQPFNPNKFIEEIPKKIGTGVKNLFKKIGKKRLIIGASSIVGLVVLVTLIFAFVVPYAPHYFDGNEALKNQEYEVAIEEFTLAKSFLNAKSKLEQARYEYGDYLFGQKAYVAAAEQYALTTKYDDAQTKIVACGEALIETKSYRSAKDVFETLTEDIAKEAKSYASGMVNIDEKKFSDARADFKEANGYRDAKKMIQACDLLEAEHLCSEGNFERAKTLYASLPEDFEYNGIYASARLSLLESSKALLDAMGTWNATDNYIESRNVYKRTGSWDSWYYGHDNVLSGQKVEVSCKMNTEGTFDITGKVTFYAFDDYSSLKEYCKGKETSRSFTIRDVTAIPASYKIDSNTTLYFTGTAFKISYSERDNYSTYFYNLYTSDVTYGSHY